MPIESPCIQVCALDPQTGLCVGCGRSGEEIAGWLRFSPEVRRRIMGRLPGRAGGKAAASPAPSGPER